MSKGVAVLVRSPHYLPHTKESGLLVTLIVERDRLSACLRIHQRKLFSSDIVSSVMSTVGMIGRNGRCVREMTRGVELGGLG